MTPTAQGRSTWWYPIPVLAMLIAVGIAMTDKDASLVDYSVRDDDTIVVTALGGSNWFWTRVHEVRETDSTLTPCTPCKEPQACRP